MRQRPARFSPNRARIAEVERVAKMGYRTLALPSEPIWRAHGSRNVDSTRRLKP